MSQQPPAQPPPPEDPPPPQGQPQRPAPRRRYQGRVVASLAIFTAIGGAVLAGSTQAVGTWLAVAVLSVLAVGGIVLDVRAQSTDLRSIGMGVLLGSGISLAFTGLCVVPLSSF